jgi:hypothetical protein
VKKLSYKVAIFDEEHEKDLEEEVNAFLTALPSQKYIDIKYHVAVTCDQKGEQIYCFSAMIIYKE